LDKSSSISRLLTLEKYTLLDLQKLKLVSLKLDSKILLVVVGPIDDKKILQFVVSDILSPFKN